MEKEILEIARQVVNNKSYKTKVIGYETGLNYLIENKFAQIDSYGVWLNSNFVTKYKMLLLKNGFHRYELKILEEGPLGVIYFRNDLIQFFIHNPKYHFRWDGYRGHIFYSDEKQLLKAFLQNLCLAYDLKNREPILAIFLNDILANHDKTFLDLIQYFEIKDKSHLEYHTYNYKNLIRGEWLGKDEEDIYKIILSGMNVLNDIFNYKYKQDFFLNIPDISELSFFRPLFFPCKLNFYLYIMEVYKIIHGNIKKKTLRKLSNIDDNKIGIRELFDIYTKRYSLIEKVQKQFKETLKRISDIRNIPSHELFENTYDKDYWKQQDYINEQLYIMFAMLIKNEIKDTEYDLKGLNSLFGEKGKISLMNGFNIPPYSYFDGQICSICERFNQGDSEILIAFKEKDNMIRQFIEYYKSNGTRLDDKELEKFCKLLFKDLKKPSLSELNSFFKGGVILSNMDKDSIDNSYIREGEKECKEFLSRYPIDHCLIIADMSDIRYTIDELYTLETLLDSGLIYNTIYGENVDLITNPREDSDIQILVNTWD